ncbi:MAG: formate dehydrogenase accessory protein FdhE [Hyphomicrobiaceae bacterium]
MSEVRGPATGTILGEEAKPPFAVLPDPSLLFINRARRFAALATGHELEPYLAFLAVVSGAQHEIQADAPAPELPSLERIGQALEHGMPPLSRALYELDDLAIDTLERLLERLAVAEVPAQSAAAVQGLLAVPRRERRRVVGAALKEEFAAEDTADHAFALAALQVQFARMAALLPASDLKPVAYGACPVCGSAPVASAIVGWPKAYNTRFCTCSLCGTMWNVVRVTCLLCSSTDGVNYRGIEGKSDSVKAETCDKCRGYVKVLYQVKDPALEPLADDVATLGLDMLLREDGWTRGGRNPFLLGY